LHNEFECCRKVVKKHEVHVTEQTDASVDAAVNILRHSCIVDIDESFIMSGTLYLVLTYCEVLSFKILFATVCCNLRVAFKL